MVEPFGVSVRYTDIQKQTHAHDAGENDVGGSMSRLFDFVPPSGGALRSDWVVAYRACCVDIAARGNESSQ